jgi:hypothetical protein
VERPGGASLVVIPPPSPPPVNRAAISFAFNRASSAVISVIVCFISFVDEISIVKKINLVICFHSIQASVNFYKIRTCTRIDSFIRMVEMAPEYFFVRYFVRYFVQSCDHHHLFSSPPIKIESWNWPLAALSVVFASTVLLIRMP